MARKLFVNLAVKDLKKAVDFFTKLGFGFNAQFTDDKATCMIVSEEAYFMLMVGERFEDFTKKPIVDAHKTTEGIYAFSCDSRAEVDRLVDTAMKNGATTAMPAQDHGFMYLRSFYDLDGHHWEAMWMDPAHVQN